MSINDKRDGVFAIARKIAREEGLSQLTIRRLAVDSDISVGSIYNLFGTKDDLIMELIEDYWVSSIKKIMSDRKNTGHSFIDQIEYLYKSFKSTSSEFHDDWIKDMVGMNMANPNILEKSNKYKSIMEIRIEEIISEDETLEPIFNDEFNSKDMAEFIFENLMILLRNEQEDLGFFRLVLERAFKLE